MKDNIYKKETFEGYCKILSSHFCIIISKEKFSLVVKKKIFFFEFEYLVFCDYMFTFFSLTNHLMVAFDRYPKTVSIVPQSEQFLLPFLDFLERESDMNLLSNFVFLLPQRIYGISSESKQLY